MTSKNITTRKDAWLVHSVLWSITTHSLVILCQKMIFIVEGRLKNVFRGSVNLLTFVMTLTVLLENIAKVVFAFPLTTTVQMIETALRTTFVAISIFVSLSLTLVLMYSAIQMKNVKMVNVLAFVMVFTAQIKQNVEVAIAILLILFVLIIANVHKETFAILENVSSLVRL